MNKMIKNGPQDWIFIIYTELKENNYPNLECYFMPLKYASSLNNKIKLDLELCISEELQKRIKYLNENIDLYSKIFIKYGDGPTTYVKG